MIQDLHSHTRHSFCSSNPTTEDGIKAAIEGGITLFGITDHQYGVGIESIDDYWAKKMPTPKVYNQRLKNYYDEIDGLKKKYEGQIQILRGIEVATLIADTPVALPDFADISYFDYCLIEHIEHVENSIARGDLFSFAKRCRCPVGIAHTDMFGFIDKIGSKPLEYFTQMAEENIFWEMNVNYDSTHGYREHEYVKTFFQSKEQIQIIKESGVKLSVGFDGHFYGDYLPQRVKDFNEKIQDLGIPLTFDDNSR